MDNYKLEQNNYIKDTKEKLLLGINAKIKDYKFDITENSIYDKYSKLTQLIEDRSYGDTDIIMEFVIEDINIDEKLCSYFSRKITKNNQNEYRDISIMNGLTYKNKIIETINYFYENVKCVENHDDAYGYSESMYAHDVEPIVVNKETLNKIDLLVKELKEEIDDVLKENTIYVIVTVSE